MITRYAFLALLELFSSQSLMASQRNSSTPTIDLTVDTSILPSSLYPKLPPIPPAIELPLNPPMNTRGGDSKNIKLSLKFHSDPLPLPHISEAPPLYYNHYVLTQNNSYVPGNIHNYDVFVNPHFPDSLRVRPNTRTKNLPLNLPPIVSDSLGYRSHQKRNRNQEYGHYNPLKKKTPL